MMFFELPVLIKQLPRILIEFLDKSNLIYQRSDCMLHRTGVASDGL